MARVEAAERQLLAARRAASKVFEEAGKSTAGIFGSSVFVPRSTAKTWVEEARQAKPEPAPRPKTAAQLHAAAMRSRDLSKPVFDEEPEDIEARDRAIARGFNSAGAEDRARMIVEAAARSRPRKK